MDPWFISLKLHFKTYNFESIAPKFRKESFEWLHQQEDDDAKLRFIARFVDADNGCLAQMIHKTRQWHENTTIDLYINLYESESAQKMAKRIAIGFLFSHEYIVPEMIQQLLTWMEDENDWDAFDILHRHENILSNPQRDILFIWLRQNRYRQHVRRPVSHLVSRYVGPIGAELQPMIWMQEVQRPPMETVYNDSQNVHNAELNDSVWDNITILQEEYMNCPISEESYQEIYLELRLNDNQYRSWQRIETDKCLFHKDKTSVSLKMILLYILSYIDQQSQEQRQELLQRLCEELKDMSGTCASGHLSRLVNVLVGYHPKINILISEHERIKASFSHLLQKMLSEDEQNDNLLIEMTTPSKNNLFVKFVQRHETKMITKMAENLNLEPDIVKNAMSTIWKQLFTQHEQNPFEEPQNKSFWSSLINFLQKRNLFRNVAF